LALAAHAHLAVTIVAFALVGVAQSVHSALWDSALREALPSLVLARVNALNTVTYLAVLPVGQLLGGLAVDRLGLVATGWTVTCALFGLPVLVTLVMRAGAVPPTRPRMPRDTAGIRTGSPAAAGSR
jgi:hypothetical protein